MASILVSEGPEKGKTGWVQSPELGEIGRTVVTTSEPLMSGQTVGFFVDEMIGNRHFQNCMGTGVAVADG